MNHKQALAAAGRFLKENDHFLVINHVSPDGDATGSLLAMGYILKTLGKSFTLVNEGETPKKFLTGELGNQVQNLTAHPLEQKYNYAIALDCGDYKRLGKSAEYLAENAELLNIDHHPTNDLFGQVNLVRTDACATCEILYDLVIELGISLTVSLANNLYMGILTDTGGFRYSNTNSEVMRKAADLLSHGVKPAEIAERCLETISSTYIRLLQLVLPTLELSSDGKVAKLTITQEMVESSGASSEDMEGIVNYARNIEGVEVGILLKQVDHDLVKMSLRSRQEVDVSAIAKALGGGGHARAAGCSFRGSLEEAGAALEQKLKEAWNDHK
ncbi:MAG TPA: bifunctional oligoribonuclease/PAP phosphatase NrnA [Bacillota bacterium]|nr:bifunctional oligoribonuclease/PAP phosphatase NrnA [Bacillota bacterium]